MGEFITLPHIDLLKLIIMNEKQFLLDLCDVINNNSDYMTIRKFRKKYEDFTFHYNANPDGSHSISVWDKDDKNEWHITVEQMYASK